MSSKQDLLIEIGTEEMPPTTLTRLADAFEKEVSQQLESEKLAFDSIRWLATPRRLALIITQLDTAQADSSEQRRGPAVDVAFDEAGKPTRATEGFARSCGVSIEELETLETDKGKWLAFTREVKGQQTSELLPGIIETALGKLPIAKRMRWGDSDVTFVRPVKWLLFLSGSEAIHCNVMNIDSGNVSYGHRFHHPQEIHINSVAEYESTLREQGKVIVDFQTRRALIEEQIQQLATGRNGQALVDADLLDEVTALVEWPVGFIGEFDESFLALPREVLIATMQDHQKYFPVSNNKQQLLPCFIGIANIESTQPELVKMGNERVIQPRLSDAAFFWERDIKHGLEKHSSGLNNVVYQKKLGTLHDRKERLKHHLAFITDILNTDSEQADRAAELCFCDLLTEMVYEFPELQGTMGKYYAQHANEDTDVCTALEEFYFPRFSGDQLPGNPVAQCLAIAEKIDALLGIFAIGQAPTGTKDPYALRRSAIGLLRIIIEGELDINLHALLQHAATAFPEAVKASDAIDDVSTFLQERLRRYYLDEGIDNDTFEAVLAVYNHEPLDFHHRLQAVTAFRELPEAKSLAAANKRITNILRKNNVNEGGKVDNGLLEEEAEKTLAAMLADYQQQLTPLLEQKSYHDALSMLAGLQDNVDGFFDNVMVMCENDMVRQNRLALLQNLHKLFIGIADISRLQEQ